jgi:hypothetical protein
MYVSKTVSEELKYIRNIIEIGIKKQNDFARKYNQNKPSLLTAIPIIDINQHRRISLSRLLKYRQLYVSIIAILIVSVILFTETTVFSFIFSFLFAPVNEARQIFNITLTLLGLIFTYVSLYAKYGSDRCNKLSETEISTQLRDNELQLKPYFDKNGNHKLKWYFEEQTGNAELSNGKVFFDSGVTHNSENIEYIDLDSELVDEIKSEHKKLKNRDYGETVENDNTAIYNKIGQEIDLVYLATAGILSFIHVLYTLNILYVPVVFMTFLSILNAVVILFASQHCYRHTTRVSDKFDKNSSYVQKIVHPFVWSAMMLPLAFTALFKIIILSAVYMLLKLRAIGLKQIQSGVNTEIISIGPFGVGADTTKIEQFREELLTILENTMVSSNFMKTATILCLIYSLIIFIPLLVNKQDYNIQGKQSYSVFYSTIFAVLSLGLLIFGYGMVGTSFGPTHVPNAYGAFGETQLKGEVVDDSYIVQRPKDDTLGLKNVTLRKIRLYHVGGQPLDSEDMDIRVNSQSVNYQVVTYGPYVNESSGYTQTRIRENFPWRESYVTFTIPTNETVNVAVFATRSAGDAVEVKKNIYNKQF